MADSIDMKIGATVVVKHSGLKEISDLLDTIEKQVRGIDFQKYWNVDPIQAATRAAREYREALSFGSDDKITSSANELLNTVKALQAVTGQSLGEIKIDGIRDLSSLFSQAKKDADAFIESVGVSAFKSAFSSLELMKETGADVEGIFNKLAMADNVEDLTAQITQQKKEIRDLTQELVNTNNELERYKKLATESGAEALRQRIEDLEDSLHRVRLDAAGELEELLQGQMIDPSDWKFENYFDSIREGEMTAIEAFTEIKTRYENLFTSDAPISSIEELTARTRELLDQVEELGPQIAEAVASNVSNNLQPVDTTGAVTEMFDTLIQRANEALQPIEGAKSATAEFLEVLRDLVNTDYSSLTQLQNILSSIMNVAGAKASGASLGHIADLVNSFAKIDDPEKVYKISKVDLSNWSAFKMTKAPVDHFERFVKLIRSKATDLDKFEKFTRLDFSNFSNLKLDKGTFDSFSQLISSITVAERLDNLERRLTGGGGGGGGNVPSGPNLVPPDTELDVLGKAMAGVGATDADIERVVGRFTELGLRAQSARAAVAEIGEEGEKLYNIVATTTDEFGNTVSHLIQYSDATNDVSVNLGNAANRLKELSEADLSKNLRSVIDLLGSREDLKGTATGQEMSRYADELGKALEAVQTGAMSANDAVNQFVTGGRAGFENLTNVVNQFKLEASQTAKPIEDAAMSEEQRANAISKLDAALNTIQANEEKWSAAQNSSKESSKAAYEIYMRQADAIGDLKEKVQTGSISQQEYAKSVATIKGEMAECERVIKSNGDAFDKNKNILVNGSAAQEKAVQRVSRAYEEAQENLRKWRSIENDPVLGAAYKQYEAAANGLAVLDTKLKSGTMSQEAYTLEWTRLSGAMASAKKTIDDSGRSFDTVGDKIGKVVSKFSSLFSTVRVFNAVKRVMREMVQNVRDLDSSFAQLRIVTGATDAEMEKFAAVSADMAKNLGQSVTDVTKSIEVFSRLGYNLSDATDLSKFATIMANVGNVTTDAATTGITAIIKGFEMEAADAEHVADVLVNVGQKYAISAEELMTAFEKSGAALHATNTDFEKSVALYAAANASIQNASTVGRMLPMRIAICV